MKTIEELNELTITQLKGIATSLGGTPDAKIKKADLVQLVHQIQQPEPNEGDDTGNESLPADESKPITTDAELATRLAAIAEHFEGAETNIVAETDDGVPVYAVVDGVTDEELARGTFVELEKEMKNVGFSNKPLDLDKEAGVGENDITADPMFEEVNTETPVLEDEDNFAEIKKGLNVLLNMGLKYEVQGSVVKLKYGSKAVTTTLNQPAHRVVRTAEGLCNFR